MSAFRFQNFECLSDGEISLLLSETAPADDAKGYVPAYKYIILKDGCPAGRCDIRIGNNEATYYGGNIGYEVFPAFRGSRFAEKACRLLKQVAAAHGMTNLYITCNPDNFPSRRTCENLGAHLTCIAAVPPGSELYELGDRQKCVYIWEI